MRLRVKNEIIYNLSFYPTETTIWGLRFRNESGKSFRYGMISSDFINLHGMKNGKIG